MELELPKSGLDGSPAPPRRRAARESWPRRSPGLAGQQLAYPDRRPPARAPAARHGADPGSRHQPATPSERRGPRHRRGPRPFDARSWGTGDLGPPSLEFLVPRPLPAVASLQVTDLTPDATEDPTSHSSTKSNRRKTQGLRPPECSGPEAFSHQPWSRSLCRKSSGPTLATREDFLSRTPQLKHLQVTFR